LTAGLFATSSAAKAADTVQPTSYDWSGIYAGINAGLAWSDTVALTNDDFKLTSGALLGYNWQHGQFVYGLEADLNYLGFGNEYRDQDFLGLNMNASERLSIDANWFGTVRGRIGIAADNLQFYGTGGLAYGHVGVDWEMDASDDDGPLGEWESSNQDVKWGWTAGAGVEYGIDRWRIGLEYLYVDLGEMTFDGEYAIDLSDSSSVEGSFEGWFVYEFSVVRATAKFSF
jgi:outer membrane immunogenic protein